MSYITEYDLDYHLKNEINTSKQRELYLELEKVLTQEDFCRQSPLMSIIMYSCSWKWFDHSIDMCRLSTLFPDFVFVLRGKGESPNDMWKKYYYRGKEQVAYANISYDRFDETKLK